LSVATIVQRLRASFAIVHVDERKGLRFVAQRIVRLSPPPDQDEIDRMLDPLSGAAEVIMADDRQSDRLFPRTYLVPDEPIVVEWVYRGQAQVCRDLLSRYADVLGHEVTNV
jgi:hypothetical protein